MEICCRFVILFSRHPNIFYYDVVCAVCRLILILALLELEIVAGVIVALTGHCGDRILKIIDVGKNLTQMKRMTDPYYKYCP